MAKRLLFVQVHFCKSLYTSIGYKNAVVSETHLSFLLLNYFTFAYPFKILLFPIENKGDDGTKLGPSIFFMCQCLQKFFDVSFRVTGFPRIPGTTHPGFTI